MKRFLLFAAFLLSLQQIVIDNSYTSVFAQKFAYENDSYWLPDVGVTGNNKTKVTCDCCHQGFKDEEAFNRHLQYDYVCMSYYSLGNTGDDENRQDDNDYGFEGQNYCPFCNRIYDRCTCQGVVIRGNKGSSNNSHYSWDIEVVVKIPENPTGSNVSSNSETITITSPTTNSHMCTCLVNLNSKIRINSIDSNPKMKALSKSHYKLAESLKRHIAFPETIQQGNNGTCVAATVQKYLAENFPDDYIDCVISLAETGRYDKWNLKIPEECYLDRIDSIDLERENQEHAEYYQKGIDYTSADMLIQTAIQNWRNEKLRLAGTKMSNYNPVVDDGDFFTAGMTLSSAKKFLQENVYGPLGGTLNVEESASFITSYDQLEDLTSQYSTDSYSFIASVAIEQNNGTYSLTTEMLPNHMLEITGINNGYVNCWTWGQNCTTSTPNNSVHKLLILKKTNDGKNLMRARKELSCYCTACSNSGCSSCTDSLTYYW